MKILQEINLLEEKKTATLLNIMSIVMLFVFLGIFGFIALLKISENVTSGEINIIELIAILPVLLIILGIHEGIHGIFFKLFCPENKVKFGVILKSGMLYATSPGSIYTRFQMITIALAPFVVLTMVLTILYSFHVISPMIYVLLASIHASGCVGDFYYTCILAFKFKEKKIMVEDTDKGITIYQAS